MSCYKKTIDRVSIKHI